MRRFFIFGGLLVLLFGAVTATASLVLKYHEHSRGVVLAAESAALPYRDATPSRLGVFVDAAVTAPDDLPTHLDLMTQAGVRWLRFETSALSTATLPWLDALQGYPHIAPVVTLTDHMTPQSAAAVITDPEAYAQQIAVFVAEYADRIDHYQVWHEPNLAVSWAGQDANPAAYVAMLCAAYDAIHANDPRAQVISAALAPTTETGPHNLSDWHFLDAIYVLGAADCMDAVAGQPFGFDSAPEDRQVDADRLNFSRIVGLREVMLRHGDVQTALWASRWGWNSLSLDWDGTPSIWGQVDAETRVSHTLNALERAEAEWPWLAGMVLYHWQPSAPLDDPVWGFALLDAQSHPTLLLDALIARHVQQAIDAAPHGLFPARNPFTAYSGLWTFSDIGADIGWQRDSRLNFTFHGTDLSLLLREDDYVGYLYVQVDGQPANALPTDNLGNSYVILTSGTRSPETNLVPIARDLPPGVHTLEIVADRGFDRWALAGFAVSGSDPTAHYSVQIAALLLTMLAALVGLITTTASDGPWLFTKSRAHLSRLLRPLNDLRRILLGGLASLLLMVGMLMTWGSAAGWTEVLRREPVQIGLALLSAGLLYVNPGFLLTLLGAGSVFLLVYHQLWLGLALILLYAPFFLFPVQLYNFAFPMVELLTLITFAAWLLRMFVTWAEARHGQSPVSRSDARWHPLDWLMLLWVFLGVLSLLWAQERGPALTELRTMIVEPTLFYLVLRTQRLSARQLRYVIGAFVLSGVIVAGLGMVFYVSDVAVITAEADARRLASIYGSPNNVALYLGRVIPFALALLLVLPLRRLLRLLLGVGLLLMLAAMALTLSAGGLFLGLPAGVAVVLLLRYRRRALIPLLGLLIISLAAFALLSANSARFARALDFESGTNFIRLRVWESSLDMIQDAPLTGLGLDQFLYAYRGTYIRPDAWEEPDLSHPHNIVLDFWLRLGLAGVLWIMAVQWVFWRGLYQRFKVPPLHPEAHALSIGLGGAMAALLAHGSIDNSVFVIDLSIVFAFMLAGSASSLSRKMNI